MSGIVVARSLVTAIGAGIVIGATGFYVILKIIQKMKKPSDRNLSTLDLSLATLEELGDLKDKPVSCSRRLTLSSHSSRSSVKKRAHQDSLDGYESDDEMFSLLSSSSEFYDCISDEFVDDEDLGKIFEEVDVLLKGNEGDRLNALKLLKTEESRLGRNPDFLWRLAKSYQMQATACGMHDIEKKREYVELGLENAEEAIRIDPSNCDAHKWYAILVGMQAEFLPVKEKIQMGFKFRKHLAIAMDGKPDDATLHHLLGRFKYEIASLSWLQRKLASALCSELPHFTMENALNDFKEAEKYNPNWVENRLYIGKCYVGLEDYENAYKWFNLTQQIKPVTPEDCKSHEEVTSLMNKYSKYRSDNW